MGKSRKPTVSELVDSLGRTRAHIAALQEVERKIRDELIAREVKEAQGEQFRLAVVSATRWTLDTAAVKAEMGAEWYDRRCKTSVAVTLRTTPLAAAFAKAA